MALSVYKWFLWTLLPALWAPQALSHAHPFYISVVEVNHNQNTASLEVSCKVFAEDMEAVLEQQAKTAVDFGQHQQKAALEKLVAAYLQKHLLLVINNKPVPLQFLGFEQDGESLYCYLEAPGVPAVAQLRVENSLLYDFTEKQINIIHVTAGGTRKSHKLDHPQTTAAFTFN